MVSQDLSVHEARRINDPVFPSAVEHVFTVNVLDLPRLPLESNPREQAENKLVYREVEASLRNQNGARNAFLGKNLGIYACARDVIKRTENDYTLHFGEGESVLAGLDGVLNGGHTAKIILNNQADLRADGTPVKTSSSM